MFFVILVSYITAVPIEESFFAHHLHETPLPEPLPPVKIFVMGRNVWRDEKVEKKRQKLRQQNFSE